MPKLRRDKYQTEGGKMTENISHIKLRNAILRQDFTSFLYKTFTTINPVDEYIHNWHIDYICHYLERVNRGEIKRLIINMPPRALKSICVSVAWPAWLLGNNPANRILTASYSRTLSEKHSLDCRMIMESDWYKQTFPWTKLSKTQNQKSKFMTNYYGFRFATSVGASVTGEGGDILIIDDPHNPSHVNSKAMREKTLEWYDKTFSSRLNDKKSGAIVLVMQRLHPEDLTAHILNKSGSNWHQLSLPAIFTEEREINYAGKSFKVKENEPLQPIKEDHATLKQIEAELGNFNFSAQYLQEPLPLDGNMVNPEDIIFYKEMPKRLSQIVQSWDTAIKSGEKSDYSVGTTWAVVGNEFYLLELHRQKLEYSQLKQAITKAAKVWKPSRILIEDKASGQSLLQDLSYETRLPLKKITPIKDKITRFARIIPYFENHRVLVPEGSSWVKNFISEITTFPSSKHDDIVDSTSHFLNFMKYQANPGIVGRIRVF